MKNVDELRGEWLKQNKETHIRHIEPKAWMYHEDYVHYLEELIIKQANDVEQNDSNCNIPLVVKSVCPLCFTNEPIEGFTVCLSCMEESAK